MYFSITKCDSYYKMISAPTSASRIFTKLMKIPMAVRADWNSELLYNLKTRFWWVNCGGKPNCPWCINLSVPVPAPMFCNKYEEIYRPTSSRDRVPGASDKFFARGESCGFNTFILKDFAEQTSDPTKDNKSYREPILNSPNSNSNFFSRKVSLWTANANNEGRILLLVCNASEFKFFRRVKTVGKQPRTIKWQGNNTTTFTVYSSNRCIKNGMGSIQ